MTSEHIRALASILRGSVGSAKELPGGWAQQVPLLPEDSADIIAALEAYARVIEKYEKVRGDRTTLLDLPVLPTNRDAAGGTDMIVDAFSTERKAISNLEELTAFVQRWTPIWKLFCPFQPDLTVRPVPLVNEKVLEWFKIFGAEGYRGEFDRVDANQISAMDILCPPLTLPAFDLAEQFGVGSDLGFVRLFLDPYPEYEGELR